MREHGTNARYRLGPNERGEPGGCRCEACREAGRTYDREYRARAVPMLVDARRARRHVRELMAAGIGPKTVAERSGVPHGSISKLIYGGYSNGKRTPPSRRIKKATEDALLAVHSGWSAGDGTWVPAGPVREIVSELVGRGWSKAAIARAIGQTGPALQLGRKSVTRRNASAIKSLLDEPVQTKRNRSGVPAESKWEPSTVERVVQIPHVGEFGGESWREKAECRRRNVPTWAFYPPLSDKRMIDAALKVCEACPVRRECREASDGYGVWGGEYMEHPVEEVEAS